MKRFFTVLIILAFTIGLKGQINPEVQPAITPSLTDYIYTATRGQVNKFTLNDLRALVLEGQTLTLVGDQLCLQPANTCVTVNVGSGGSLTYDHFGRVLDENGAAGVYASPEPDDCLLFIGEGQSNEAGAANVTDFSASEQAINNSLFVRSETTTRVNRLEALDPAIGNHTKGNSNTSGTILTLGAMADTLFPVANIPIYYSVGGYSGNNISEWLESGPNAGAPLYNYEDRRTDARAMMETVAATGCDLKIVHLWMQGEADAKDQPRADAYAARLDSFLEDRNKIYGTEVVTIAGLITEKKPTEYPFASTVNAALQARADTDPYFLVYDTNVLDYSEDSLHLSVEGYRQRGRAIFRTMKENNIPFGTDWQDRGYENCGSGTMPSLSGYASGWDASQLECFTAYRGLPIVKPVPGEAFNGLTTRNDSLYLTSDEETRRVFRYTGVPFDAADYTVEWKMKYNGGSNAGVILRASGYSLGGIEGYEFRIQPGAYYAISRRNDQTIIGTDTNIDTPAGTVFHYRATVTGNDMIFQQTTDGGTTWTTLNTTTVPDLNSGKKQRLERGTAMFFTDSVTDGVFFWDIETY